MSGREQRDSNRDGLGLSPIIYLHIIFDTLRNGMINQDDERSPTQIS
jgi:hypothetical protein